MPLTKVHKGFFFQHRKFFYTSFSFFLHCFSINQCTIQSVKEWQEQLALMPLLATVVVPSQTLKLIILWTSWGEIIPIGPSEWASAVNHHKVSFANKNRDMQSLQQKLNSLSRMTLSTSDPNVPQFFQKAKDVQHAIEIKMDSGRVTFHDLGIDIADDTGGLDGDGSNLDGKL